MFAILHHYFRIKLPYNVATIKTAKDEPRLSSAVDIFPPYSSAAVKTRDALERGFFRRDRYRRESKANRFSRTADFCRWGKKSPTHGRSRSQKSQEIPRFFRRRLGAQSDSRFDSD